jgi:Carboxypeptidase regulatory-like domain
MQELGKLSGRVLDAAGEPVSSADVWLTTENWRCQPSSCFGCYPRSKTDERGVFTFKDLEPGRWVLSATAPPFLHPPKPDTDQELGWAQTFFPGVVDPQNAEAVTIQPGDQWNPDIKLAAVPVHRVLGKILGPRGNPVSIPAPTCKWRVRRQSPYCGMRSSGDYRESPLAIERISTDFVAVRGCVPGRAPLACKK